MSDKLLQANKKAAELLGHKLYYVEGQSLMLPVGGGLGTRFSIENPADRDAVVQALLKRDMGFQCVSGGYHFKIKNRGWFFVGKDYTDAVIAAVESI